MFCNNDESYFISLTAHSHVNIIGHVEISFCIIYYYKLATLLHILIVNYDVILDVNSQLPLASEGIRLLMQGEVVELSQEANAF